ncbi:hypothetical protein [Niveibacterium sp.]|uniref:hypothetical protein n=1 Tax=Niveibacterium sp. TaxID=2017444 RepID=UPI0035B21DBA
MADTVRDYAPPGPVAKAFMKSDGFVRGICGPIGSGKSTACVLEILRRAQMQAPGPDGVRRTRWAVIRNSYPELKTTTLRTWLDWVPPEYGKVTYDSPIRHFVQAEGFELEVLFIALDREDDARKLLSLELTGAWINEAREIPKAILDALTGRVGRYPSKLQGGCSWSGIIMDTNPPDTESWWYRMAEQETPEEWQFFRQPSGLSDQAENRENLPAKYYERASAGKDPDWCRVYVHGEYGFVTEGKPVYPMFRDRTHTAPQAIEPVAHVPLLVGVDFGLTPAAIIGQKLPNGQWLILDEVVTEDCGIIRFAELLASYVARTYPDHKVEAGWGDPAGNARSATDERTALAIIEQYTGWRWRPAPSNDVSMRLEVVRAALNRMIDGDPGFVLSPRCSVLRKGFAGGYCFKAVRSGNGAMFHETPAKNGYSHPHDALQYLLLGGGEHHVVLQKTQRAKRRARPVASVDYDLFAATGDD